MAMYFYFMTIVMSKSGVSFDLGLLLQSLPWDIMLLHLRNNQTIQQWDLNTTLKGLFFLLLSMKVQMKFSVVPC